MASIESTSTVLDNRTTSYTVTNIVTKNIALIGLVSLSIFLAIVAFATLRWHMVVDSPILMYQSFLIDHFHFVPYRDFFVQNSPGAFIPYLVIGKLFGFDNELGFRIFDLAYLGALLAVTWLWLRS